MPKQIYCGACGLELLQLKKVVRQEIFNFVEPHGCIDPAELPPIKERDLTLKNVDQPESIDELFDSFETVQKLNKLVEKDRILEPAGDLRKKENLRKELTLSTAPKGLQGMISTEVQTRPDEVGEGQTESDLE
jgi:hypothetical protein